MKTGLDEDHVKNGYECVNDSRTVAQALSRQCLMGKSPPGNRDPSPRIFNSVRSSPFALHDVASEWLTALMF